MKGGAGSKGDSLTQDIFASRHLGPDARESGRMAEEIGFAGLEALIDAVVPEGIRLRTPFRLKDFPKAQSEFDVLERIRGMAGLNRVYRSYIGTGYSDCITPPVIQRNILENPGWYTQYTPYQPEISQGRLEALLNYQTLITDLTRLDVANASMLDEGTAAAEAMAMSYNIRQKAGGDEASTYIVSSSCHPQTIDVVRTRAEALGLSVIVADEHAHTFDSKVFGVLIQYPGTDGVIRDPRDVIARAKKAGAVVTVAADIMALVLLEAPGAMGADMAVGNSQRFGVPLGFGGPHAAFFATRDEYKRSMPGRLIGVSKDSEGRSALRLALQTREQHIRREKATSNICTAQVLLAVMAGMYAVYHGPQGLKRIARRIHAMTALLSAELRSAGLKVRSAQVFDTVVVEGPAQALDAMQKRGIEKQINFRRLSETALGISLDETTREQELAEVLSVLTEKSYSADVLSEKLVEGGGIPESLLRTDTVLQHPVFQQYHTETEFLRYIRRLESRDLSLGTAMIPLGSCTMKLNATTEMLPLSWPEFSRIHPFVPADQRTGYLKLFQELESALSETTGFDAVSLQPNAGSQGEYAGLLAIAGYHQANGNGQSRRVCLIPTSAHGTNPASAVMAGFEVVVVQCDAQGNIDLPDLKAKIEQYRDSLGALMVTYPSTHGVFEESIREVCELVHEAGGQVYMDGANLNALVGLCRPADIGADVCHINLHKTFCIPHGGGGPGMGPIGVRKHLAPFLPGHAVVAPEGRRPSHAVSAAPWGSASILTISWSYIALMGGAGLQEATKVAILNANYIAKKLEPYFPVLYRGSSGLVAHECILDLRPLKKESGIEVEDIAKRLMDYGFHAPTISFPVPGTIMIEPTESENRAELDRFIEAMIGIRHEIQEVIDQKIDAKNNPLKNAPHTATQVTAETWDRPYSRERAAYPAAWLKEYKFWPAVGRIDGNYGDRNLICTCPDIESYSKQN